MLNILALQKKNNNEIKDYFNVNSNNLDYTKEEQLAVLNTIKKNSLNSKIMNKRTVGGS
jgi:hypothetical protein